MVKKKISRKKKLKQRGKKNPMIAIFLSLVLIGLGQVYNGQVKKGILFFLVAMTLSVLFLTGVLPETISLVLYIPAYMFWLYSIYDAYTTAKKSK